MIEEIVSTEYQSPSIKYTGRIHDIQIFLTKTIQSKQEAPSSTLSMVSKKKTHTYLEGLKKYLSLRIHSRSTWVQKIVYLENLQMFTHVTLKVPDNISNTYTLLFYAIFEYVLSSCHRNKTGKRQRPGLLTIWNESCNNIKSGEKKHNIHLYASCLAESLELLTIGITMVTGPWRYQILQSMLRAGICNLFIPACDGVV